MAWQLNTGRRQYRKDASAAQRSHLARIAIAGEDDNAEARRRNAAKKKPFGLEFHLTFGGRPLTFVKWYNTKHDRDQAERSASVETVGYGSPRPRYDRIVQVSR